MFYSLKGVLEAKKDNFLAINVGGVGYKVFTSKTAFESAPALSAEVKVFCYLKVKEDALDLYGFFNEADLDFFKALITVDGVGPKSALNIMGLSPVKQLVEVIGAGRVDLLTKASGVGQKTAEKVILELKGKLASISEAGVQKMEADLDLEETLVGLGYSRANARASIAKIDPKLKDFNERLKAALQTGKKA